jgi:hypothetical protein
VSGAQDGLAGLCRGFDVGVRWYSMLDRVGGAGGPQSLVWGYSMSEMEDRLVKFAEQRG